MKRLSLRNLRRAIRRHGARAQQFRRSDLYSRFFFERLEPRLVFAVQLASGPLPDMVTVSPGQQLNQYDVTGGPALPADTGSFWGSTFAGTGLYQTSGSN